MVTTQTLWGIIDNFLMVQTQTLWGIIDNFLMVQTQTLWGIIVTFVSSCTLYVIAVSLYCVLGEAEKNSNTWENR